MDDKDSNGVSATSDKWDVTSFKGVDLEEDCWYSTEEIDLNHKKNASTNSGGNYADDAHHTHDTDDTDSANGDNTIGVDTKQIMEHRSGPDSKALANKFE